MNKAKIFAALLLATGGASIAGCNTVAGVGEDVQAAGTTVEEAADEAEDDITDGEQ